MYKRNNPKTNCDLLFCAITMDRVIACCIFLNRATESQNRIDSVDPYALQSKIRTQEFNPKILENQMQLKRLKEDRARNKVRGGDGL